MIHDNNYKEKNSPILLLLEYKKSAVLENLGHVMETIALFP